MESTTVKSLKETVLEKIESLSEIDLKVIDGMLNQLENKTSKKDKILSFAGLLDKVQDADLIKELTVDLHKTRLKGNRNIADNWKSHF
jgi:hypothetical protein